MHHYYAGVNANDNNRTKDEKDADVTGDDDDVTSEAGTYTIDSSDGDDNVRRARTADIDDTLRISHASGI